MSKQHKPDTASLTPSSDVLLYGGDVFPREAWQVLSEDVAAQLVDVRTTAEWAYVGLSDLSPLGKAPMLVEWQSFPDMQRNPRFEDELKSALEAAGVKRSAPLFFICRSGVRSRAAAIAMSEAGFIHCFNVAGGFEGDPDEQRQRGKKNGWKVEGLPWKQG